ncbi:TPA: hypothetical protein L4Y58_005067 [Escherichia coli]|nr:hypothetical protein [Escherichia coli]HBV0476017.1 hypothetical protein [Escherichia coli]
MNEQRLFEMTSQTNLKGHVAKSIAPFQLRISIHRIIENMILGKIALPIDFG